MAGGGGVADGPCCPRTTRVGGGVILTLACRVKGSGFAYGVRHRVRPITKALIIIHILLFLKLCRDLIIGNGGKLRY